MTQQKLKKGKRFQQKNLMHQMKMVMNLVDGMLMKV